MKKLSIVFLSMILVFAFSCKTEETDKEKLKEELKAELLKEMEGDDEKKEDDKSGDTATASKELVMKTFDKSMAQSVDYEGKIIHGEAWEDANGKNFVIFTEKEIEHKSSSEYEPPSASKYLYAYHYADKGSGFKLLRKIQDFEEKCDLVNHAEFRLKTLNITDINKDGKAEITFVYRTGCNGDPTPVTMKLMMLEDGEKYAIRGTTLVELSPEYSDGGEMNVGPEFKNAPAGFLDFAKKIWNSDKMYF